jgi:hypothetical protein
VVSLVRQTHRFKVRFKQSFKRSLSRAPRVEQALAVLPSRTLASFWPEPSVQPVSAPPDPFHEVLGLRLVAQRMPLPRGELRVHQCQDFAPTPASRTDEIVAAASERQRPADDPDLLPVRFAVGAERNDEPAGFGLLQVYAERDGAEAFGAPRPFQRPGDVEIGANEAPAAQKPNV